MQKDLELIEIELWKYQDFGTQYLSFAAYLQISICS